MYAVQRKESFGHLVGSLLGLCGLQWELGAKTGITGLLILNRAGGL